MACRALIADDHEVVRQGFRALLEKNGHMVVGEASNGREACDLAKTLQPNIAVLDLSMPLLNGLEAARELRRIAPDTKAVLLTMHTDPTYVFKALQAGARGYVLKTQALDDLLRAIHEVMRGAVYISPCVSSCLVDAALGRSQMPGEPLTPREEQVLHLVAEGKTTKMIANVLSISFKTAESHRNRIMRKLDIHDTAGLVRYAIRQGVIQP